MPVPGPDETPGGPPASGSPCRDCGSPTAEDQRYCLACGARVGERRLEPLAVLAARAEALAPAPVPAPAGAARGIPLAAAATAILVAGVSGMLVTGARDGGARAAIVTPPAAAPAATVAAPATAPAAATPSDATDDATPDAPASDAADPPVDETTAAAPADETTDEPATDDASDDGSDTGTDGGDDDGATAPDPGPPHVWVLALEGPLAQEAIDRVAKQGVRLTGMRALSADVAVNATGLVTGARPAAAAATADPAAASAGDAASSLPEQLLADKRKWRAYVDSLATGGPAPAGACAPAPAGDAAGAALAARLPFGRIAAFQKDAAGCTGATTSLEALGNDLSTGDGIPDLSYAALGGCAPADRSVVALPDELDDAVTTITSSTEYQESGLLIVTTVGAADPCPTVPATPADPAAPVPPITDPAAATVPAEPPLAPTVVFRADARPGTTVATPLDQLALTRAAAEALKLTVPADAAAETVPALALPKAKQR